MQIISSLLNLQSMAIDDKQMLQVIQEIQNRIRSLSLVHEKLFEARDLSNISLKDYIEDLAQALVTSYQGSNKRISVTVDVEDVFLSLDSITSCGLIINELLSNSLKYAFPDEKAGNIRIVLQSTDKGEIELRISDNGIGLPEGLDFENPKTLGLKLVRGLAEDQLRGKIELTNKKRAAFLITLKEAAGHTKNTGS
jgi:two-component sensor histidine kinase